MVARRSVLGLSARAWQASSAGPHCLAVHASRSRQPAAAGIHRRWPLPAARCVAISDSTGPEDALPPWQGPSSGARIGSEGPAVTEAPHTDGPPAPMPAAQAAARRVESFRLLGRLLAYHAALAAGLVILLAMFPSIRGQLPIGGVQELAAGAGIVGYAEPARPELDPLGYARRLAIALVGTWLLMLPVSWVHKGIHRSSAYDHSLDGTTLIMPGIVAAIVLVVQYSLALAFALAGIVAGVQFRRALQDTFDALFILVAIGTGIAAGVGALEVAAVMTVFFCYATLYVGRFGGGFESDFLAERKEKKRLRKANGHKDAESGHGPP
ncbi:MAG TPA: hypothetical protein PLD19_11095 [Luteimonas sp.]|nr:hypothetical protein [Luteimonas sp.]